MSLEFSTIPSEDSQLFDPTVEEISSPVDTEVLLKMFDVGFRELPTLYGGGMNRSFERDFPFAVAPWRVGAGRQILQSLNSRSGEQDVEPVQLDHINNFQQQTDSDCVGAAMISAFSTITGTEITSELYSGFLNAAQEHDLAEQEDNGLKVLPFVFNVLATHEFKQAFPISKVTVAYRKSLSLQEVSEIVRTARDKKHKSYVFLPFSSWTSEESGHLVTLQKIDQSETTIYDPKTGSKRTLLNTECNKRWGHDNNSAIFVFAKDNL